jgi:ABC-type glycerol-3-phosphate transport system substrate-binding protein
MYLSRRRMLGSVALGAGAVIAAACGQSGSTPAGGNAPAPSATSAPAAAAPAASGAGAVTINVIAWNSGSSAEAFKNAMSQINDKFKQKRSNVTINFEPLGQGPTWTNAQMARIAGQTADVTATYGFAPQDIINFQPDTHPTRSSRSRLDCCSSSPSSPRNGR